VGGDSNFTSALSNIDSSTHEAGAVAKIAATCKTAKCSNLSSQHTFYPIAVETLSPLNDDARLMLSDLGRHISAASGDLRELFYCFREFLLLCSVSMLYCCTTVLLSRNKCHLS